MTLMILTTRTTLTTSLTTLKRIVFFSFVNFRCHNEKILKKTEKYNQTYLNSLTAYDKQSIMHFDPSSTWVGHFPTPVVTDKKTGKAIGLNKEMSPFDIEKLNMMYPC